MDVFLLEYKHANSLWHTWDKTRQEFLQHLKCD